jgi:hypothetical protein
MRDRRCAAAAIDSALGEWRMGKEGKMTRLRMACVLAPTALCVNACATMRKDGATTPQAPAANSEHGRLTVGDDFDGTLTLINRQTRERTLLSAGRLTHPDQAHPKFCPDGTRALVQSGRLSKGESLDLAVIQVREFLHAPAR